MFHPVRIMDRLRLSILVSVLLACILAGSASAIITEQVSMSSTGVPVNGGPGNMSADGRYVVFVSDVDGVVPGDTNGVRDVFVFDRQTGVTERVSVASGDPGGQANGPSCEFSLLDDEVWDQPCISGNGRYVVFSSSASNLVSGDVNGLRDIFVRDTVNHTTERVSVSSSEVQSNGVSCYPSISSDGAHVAFASVATNLVSGDTNGAADVFLRDLPAGNTYRASLSSSGAQATGQEIYHTGGIPDSDITARISGDGLHVAFASSATNLVPGDTNDTYDMFVRDVNATNHGSGVTERASVSTSGQQGNGFCWGNNQIISNDGSVVVFSSFATNLDSITPDTNGQNDVFVRDRNAHTTRRVSLNWLGGQSNATSNDPSCSADGNKIAFHNWAGDLLPGGDGVLDVYIVNKDGTGLERLGVDSEGAPLPGWDAGGFMSADGRFVSMIHLPAGVPDFFSTTQALVADRSAITVSQAKKKGNDLSVIIGGGVVSAVFDGSFYLQQDGISSPERACGIRVDSTGEVSVGKRYVVTGAMKTDTTGERYVEATAVDPHTSGWTVDAKPLGLTNKALGGSNWHYDSPTGAGQIGVTGGVGLNNIGLLAKITGSLTYVDAHTFTIDDGSDALVTCVTPTTILANPAWQYAAVTGIISIKKMGDEHARLLRVTSIGVIASNPTDGVTGRWEITGTSGEGGVVGMLLTQQGTAVQGSVRGAAIADGAMNGNVLTGHFVISDQIGAISLSLTLDGDTLAGTYTFTGGAIPVTLHRVSPDPVSPYFGHPQVLSATCDGDSIDVTWDRPINGWDSVIYRSGVRLSAEAWADKDNFSYDPGSHTYHMAMLPSTPLVSGLQYTVALDEGVVDWHDPYGVPAWATTASAYTFTFTAP